MTRHNSAAKKPSNSNDLYILKCLLCVRQWVSGKEIKGPWTCRYVEGKRTIIQLSIKLCDNMNQVPGEHRGNTSFCLGRRVKEGEKMSQMWHCSKGNNKQWYRAFQHIWWGNVRGVWGSRKTVLNFHQVSFQSSFGSWLEFQIICPLKWCCFWWAGPQTQLWLIAMPNFWVWN